MKKPLKQQPPPNHKTKPHRTAQRSLQAHEPCATPCDWEHPVVPGDVPAPLHPRQPHPCPTGHWAALPQLCSLLRCDEGRQARLGAGRLPQLLAWHGQRRRLLRGTPPPWQHDSHKHKVLIHAVSPLSSYSLFEPQLTTVLFRGNQRTEPK